MFLRAIPFRALIPGAVFVNPHHATPIADRSTMNYVSKLHCCRQIEANGPFGRWDRIDPQVSPCDRNDPNISVGELDHDLVRAVATDHPDRLTE